MLGALGGARLEHSLANIATGLFLAQNGVEVLLADARSELHYLLPNAPLTLQKGDWQYLSLFPLQGTLQGVTLTGVYYPLQMQPLPPIIRWVSATNLCRTQPCFPARRAAAWQC